MTIETFDHEQFEQVLTDANLDVNPLGYIDGEICYHVRLDAQSGIRIRSSIRHDGASAKVGEDSIRLWLVGNQAKSLVGKNTIQEEHYIQRVAGWQNRLLGKIKQLRFVRSKLGTCRDCQAPNKIGRVTNKTSPNRDKVYIRCSECSGWSHWVSHIELESFNARQESFLSTEVSTWQTIVPTTRRFSQESELPSSESISSAKSTDAQLAASTISTIAAKSISSNPNSENKLPPTLLESDMASFPSNFSRDTGLAFLADVADLPAEPELVAAKPFTPSAQQLAIREQVEGRKGNCLVGALAGTGKTSSEVYVIQFIPTTEKTIYLVFGTRDAEDARAKFPASVTVKTTHSQSLANAKRVYPHAKVDETGQKLRDILRANYSYDDSREYGAAVKKFIGLCQNRLMDPTSENLDWLADRYGIEVNGGRPRAYAMTAEIFKANSERTDLLSFDDMLHLSASGQVPCEQFDRILGDEVQDWNPAQKMLVQRSLKSGGQVLLVGDEHQAIFGFRGADTESIANLRAAFQPSELPLTVCYRCPRKVIELAQQIVPEIQWREDAPDGVIETLPLYRWKERGQPELDIAKFSALVKPGDLILCRTNAPLVKPCFDLIRRKIKATIRGRNIGKGLVDLLERQAKHTMSNNLQTVLYALSDYVCSEVAKLIAMEKNARAQMLEDQMETIIAVADGCTTVAQVKEKIIGDYAKGIEGIFSDKVAAVTFSSTHRAKGDESNRVFILRPDLMPHPLATKEWEMTQEWNLKYVALTRAKQELYFVQ